MTGGDTLELDYSRMTDNELHELYYDSFGVCFAMQWDDDDMHRDKVIACLESGIPQDVDDMTMDVPDGAVA